MAACPSATPLLPSGPWKPPPVHRQQVSLQGVKKGREEEGCAPTRAAWNWKQLTRRFQIRVVEAGGTELSQHIGEPGARRLAQLVSRTS